MAAILFVRIKSGLDAQEFERRLVERRPRFREVPGLVQKIYGRDEATGDVCGIYFFESEEQLAAFRETELARTIPAAYEAIDVRREVYEVLYPLWPERGRSPTSIAWRTRRASGCGAAHTCFLDRQHAQPRLGFREKNPAKRLNHGKGSPSSATLRHRRMSAPRPRRGRLSGGHLGAQACQ
jgi:Putative mono-oxygenase ydhR